LSSESADATVLSRRYSAALRRLLAQKPAASLRPAERLGREALAGGLDALDVVRIHERALNTLLPRDPGSTNGKGAINRAARFLSGALTPFNGQTRRNGELAHIRRQLRREIGRRKSVQEALRKSERHYGELLAKSRHMQEHLRRLSREILAAHENERKRISRELHDEVGQTLTAINVKLGTLRKVATVNSSSLKQKISSTQRLVEKSMNTVHRFARELRPPLLDDLGLIPALRSFLKDFTKRTRIPVRFTAFAAVEQLASDKRIVLYRVAQEAFTNVAKHAHAGMVELSIQRRPGVVRMEIHDNGKSFAVDRVLLAKTIKRLGLLGMRERVEMVGGSFTIESAPGSGTTVGVQIPFGRGRKA
jgi:two-component system, NarL family, sensor histidine kinase DegS